MLNVRIILTHKYPVWEICRAAGVKLSIYRGVHIFYKYLGGSQISMRRNGDVMEVPHWESINSMHHKTTFSRQGDVAPGICLILYIHHN